MSDGKGKKKLPPIVEKRGFGGRTLGNLFSHLKGGEGVSPAEKKTLLIRGKRLLFFRRKSGCYNPA